MREALERVLARDHQVLGSRRGVASAFEVKRDHGRELAPPLGVEREQRVGGEGVERPAVLLQKRAVGGVLDERVPEEVLELRLERGHLHEAARLERAQLSADGHSVFASRSRSSIATPNCRPITAATRRVRLLSGGSRSMRARSSP